MKIKKNLKEINKPSELTQTIFFKNDECNAFTKLTATQMDMFNLLFYKSREHFIKNQTEIGEFIPFEMDLMDFSKELNKYSHNDYKSMVDQLVELMDIKVVINALGKNKEMKTTFTKFIHKISISKHKNRLNKKARIVLDGEICQMVFDVKKLFTKFYLKIQFSMCSKYSKLLYELLKDYEGVKTKIIQFDLLLGLMNVDHEGTRNGEWALFNQNILKKAVKEINKKSDIFVECEGIKEKLEGKRKQVTQIKFVIRKQPESRLRKLGLIEESITSHKLYKKSKGKLNKLIKKGYKVVDEEMWVKTDIKKNSERYESEKRIDTWLKETEKEEQNNLYELLARSLDDCEDPIVSIEDYLIRGVFSKDAFSRNPVETIELLNGVISENVN